MVSSYGGDKKQALEVCDRLMIGGWPSRRRFELGMDIWFQALDRQLLVRSWVPKKGRGFGVGQKIRRIEAQAPLDSV